MAGAAAGSTPSARGRSKGARPSGVDLDLVTIGRASVDLYGQQVGGRLEDMMTLTKAVGGCPTNIAIGTARLGLRSAVVTRVGDEQMGRFIREQLVREGVDVSGVQTDPTRLTALVIQGVRDDDSFPMIFYRTDCADAALDEDDIDEALIARAGAICVTGTHFARENTAAAQRKAMRLAQTHGRKIVFDIDYRPNLWGLAGHDAGGSRYVRSDAVTIRMGSILPDCDLVVGTEEELHIAGGFEDTLQALRAIREVTAALIVLKRGSRGCVVFDGEIPATLEQGIRGPGFPVEIYNVLGAGDAFMSGFLRGWLRREPLATCCAYANACGAFAVSRLLCSPEYPTWPELTHFLNQAVRAKVLRHDAELAHIHAATTRRPQPEPLFAFAIDHRIQLEAIADKLRASRERIPAFKELAVEATARVAAGRPGFGMLLDGTYGREALFRAEDKGFWIGRPVEVPGSRPLDFEGAGSLAAHIAEWPVGQTVKCLCFYHPDDPHDLRGRQERELHRLMAACRTSGREVILEIIAGKHGAIESETVARILRRLYEIGIRPDWWKLEPQATARAWSRICQVIETHDPWCRGIVMLGLEAPAEELAHAFTAAAEAPMVKGFAVGRTLFADPATQWLAGRIDDEQATDAMAERFSSLITAWKQARHQVGG